jgi:hypothetical protein
MVFYRFHPFFGRQVSVLKHVRGGECPLVLVRVDPRDGEDTELRVQIPYWMLCEPSCESVVVETQPRIDVAALVDLRRVLDHLGETSRKVGNDPEVAFLQGECCDSNASPSAAAADSSAQAKRV